jgi:pyruvate formate lyase activating enzyme
MIEAKYYNRLDNNDLQCNLCPHECIIAEGKYGICNVRKNISGRLFSLVYGNPVTLHFDPIEKKPLYHFYPATNILSIGTVGCNLKCFYCQNSEISQAKPDEQDKIRYSPEEIIHLAGSKSDNTGIAYTYNESVIFFEYMIDIAVMAKRTGLKNVMVTNGFINEKPRQVLLEYIDAFNVDLKSFSDQFYRKHTHSRLEPVLETIKSIHTSGKHLEITNLIIPGLNDQEESFKEMVKWIYNECGDKTVFHISRYFPRYKCSLPPTSVNTLNNLFDIAKEYLPFVYTGNFENEKGQNTVCPCCNAVVIERKGYHTGLKGLDNKGFCEFCGTQIIQCI